MKARWADYGILAGDGATKIALLGQRVVRCGDTLFDHSGAKGTIERIGLSRDDRILFVVRLESGSLAVWGKEQIARHVPADPRATDYPALEELPLL